MKRKAILLFLCLNMGSLVFAQQADPLIISPAGSSETGTTVKLDWTLGELAVHSLETYNTMLTEGFHQPILKVEAFFETPESSFIGHINAWAGPNPTSAHLNINIESFENGKGKLTLKTINGIILQKGSINLSSGNHKLNMKQYPAGLYILTLTTEKGELLKSFKIAKID